VVNYIAHQLKLEASLFAQYDWEGRTIKLHRTQIGEQYQFREATDADTEDMAAWLIQTACVTYEQQFFETVLGRLPEATRAQLDALLEQHAEETEEEDEPEIQCLEPEGRHAWFAGAT
jgi:Domain of unknown function (DUF4158)